MTGRFRRVRLGMGTRLLAAFAALLVPFVVFSAWSHQQSRTERRDVAVAEAVTFGQTAAAVVYGLLRDLDGTTLAMSGGLGAQ